MITFKQFIAEAKNTHMEHAEDIVFIGGTNGLRQAINSLRQLRDILGGHKKGSVSVKWDGAPAIFAGIDPTDGKFFVAKKGIFNKNPKVYKSEADVDEDIPNADLANKMKTAYKYLKPLGIKGVIQGDILFTQDDLKTETIDGEKFITFHPNTIVYAVPTDSPSGEDVRRSKIGIVWHTRYEGDSFENMSAKFGTSIDLPNTKDVWNQDALLKDLTDITLDTKRTEQLNARLSTIGKLFNKLSTKFLNELADSEAVKLMMIYSNANVRSGVQETNPKRWVAGYEKFVSDRFAKEIDKRKTQKGKGAQIAKRDVILNFIQDNMQSLMTVVQIHGLFKEAKDILLPALNRLTSTATFVRTKDGFKTTGDEGFVAIDSVSGNAVKIVDRLEFSKNNFSDEIIKGWQR